DGDLKGSFGLRESLHIRDSYPRTAVKSHLFNLAFVNDGLPNDDAQNGKTEEARHCNLERNLPTFNEFPKAKSFKPVSLLVVCIVIAGFCCLGGFIGLGVGAVYMFERFWRGIGLSIAASALIFGFFWIVIHGLNAFLDK